MIKHVIEKTKQTKGKSKNKGTRYPKLLLGISFILIKGSWSIRLWFGKFRSDPVFNRKSVPDPVFKMWSDPELVCTSSLKISLKSRFLQNLMTKATIQY